MEGCNEARHDNGGTASSIDVNGLFGGRSSDSADQDSFLTKDLATPLIIGVDRIDYCRTMEEMLNRLWEDFAGRAGGPLTLRLLIQPTMATLLSIRAGLRDSRQGRTPYFWNVLLTRANRRDLLGEGWKDVGKLFIMACVLDIVYQLIVARWIYPLETVVVAIVLAILPYVIVRGVACRLGRRCQRKHKDLPAPEV